MSPPIPTHTKSRPEWTCNAGGRWAVGAMIAPISLDPHGPQIIGEAYESGWQDALREVTNAVAEVRAGRRSLAWLERRLANHATQYPEDPR